MQIAFLGLGQMGLAIAKLRSVAKGHRRSPSGTAPPPPQSPYVDLGAFSLAANPRTKPSHAADVVFSACSSTTTLVEDVQSSPTRRSEAIPASAHP